MRQIGGTVNIRQIALLPAMVLGAALGGAALVGVVANADPSNQPFTPNDFNNWPLSQLGPDYNYDLTGSKDLGSIPGIYTAAETTTNWQIFDTDGNTTGSFDSTLTHYQLGPPFPFGYVVDSNVVSDSDGTGLPDGTTWDSSGLYMAGFALFGSQSVTLPDDMTADFFTFFGLANEVVTSDAGITDYMYFFGPDPILLFDIPA